MTIHWIAAVSVKEYYKSHDRTFSSCKQPTQLDFFNGNSTSSATRTMQKIVHSYGLFPLSEVTGWSI